RRAPYGYTGPIGKTVISLAAALPGLRVRLGQQRMTLPYPRPDRTRGLDLRLATETRLPDWPVAFWFGLGLLAPCAFPIRRMRSGSPMQSLEKTSRHDSRSLGRWGLAGRERCPVRIGTGVGPLPA